MLSDCHTNLSNEVKHCCNVPNLFSCIYAVLDITFSEAGDFCFACVLALFVQYWNTV